MQIRRLKLSGFKSFVDPTELRIEPGLTGIVGPNGCGKSNLLEAIRWVMGESSAKSMRGGGMEDVIFAGTATRPQRDFAEVSLLTQIDTGDALPSLNLGEDGDLEVIRRIERGAGSAYRANGRDVRAKDVALIFADAATGAHSPALVSQGRIAAVIAAKPQERRAMLEEAAGIAGLHVRRKDAEQKLRAAEANLARLADILADMDGRAASLRRQARAAERYTALSAQIRVAEARVLFARWREAAASAEAARKEAALAEEAVEKALQAQRILSADVQDRLTALADARAAAVQARDAANAAGHRITALRTERDSLRQRQADLEDQARRIEEDKAREDALAHDAAQAIERLSSQAEQLKARIDEAEAQRPTFAARIAQAETASRDAELDLARAMATQAGEQAERRVAEAAAAAARTRYEKAVRDLDRTQQERDALPQMEPLQASLDTARAAQEQATKDRDGAEAGIAQAEAARADAAVARADAESALSSAQAALAALDGEANALRRAVEAGGSKKDRALDRIKAAAGYERALAAALGDDLGVPIGGDGKSRWAGAAMGDRDPPLPMGCERLADHVTAPDELKRRLSQIAVAQEDEGQALAVGQRLVTRDGRLRRWDGFVALEGGLAAAERLVRLNRLEAIDTARPEALVAVDVARGRRDAAGAAAQQADGQLTACRKALADADARLRAALRAADEASGGLERLAARQAQVEERLAELRSEHNEAEAEQEAAMAALADLPDGGETRALVTALGQASDKARALMAQVQAEQAMADRSIAADRDMLAGAKTESLNWRNRSGEAVRRIADMDARADAIAQERTRIGDKPDRLSEELSALEVGSLDLSEQARVTASAEAAAETALRAAEVEAAKAGEAHAQAREHRAGAVARAESADQRRIETTRESGERFECPPPLLPERIGFDSATMRIAQSEQGEHDRLVADRERIGPVNLVAATELAQLEEEQATSRAEAEELTQAINRLRGSIGSLNREGRSRLLAAFEAVDGHFRRLFTTLFNGGQAHLQLIDSDDPLEAGLEIMAQPPGKKLSALTLLSGGEQALTAVALIFGLFLTNPAPICVLDEVDAPLDDANVERFCDLLDQMTRDTRTRYLIVTHNAVTMARMHRLFGVTMIERGVSRLVSVDLGAAEELLAAE